MKNYPILSLQNFIPYKVYNNSYLEELNKMVFSLFQYSEYQVPDFKEFDIEVDPDKDFDLRQLFFHNYYQLPKDTTVFIKQKINNQEELIFYELLPASTVIINYARAEGTVDKHPNSNNNIICNKDNYFFQPMSWGSYYIPYFMQEKGKNIYQFYFDQYAEEKYGRELYLSFDPFYARYFVNLDCIKRDFINGVNKEVILSARNIQDNKNYIIDKQGHIWSAYKTNPVMGFTFLKSYTLDEQNEHIYNENEYGEEIITDTKWQLSTFERTNIARYTIMSNTDSSDWPDNNHAIVVDII